MGVKFADKAATTITGGIAADATSVTVSSASGFPDITGAGDFFYATLERANDATTYEVVKVTNLSSTTYTIDRSVESSSTFSAGDTFALRLNEHALVDPSLLQAGITTDTFTVDAGSGSSEATLHSSTGAAKLHINTDASGGTRYASIELGGTDGAFIDLKEPNSDDYDFRIEHGIGSENVSFVSSKHPLILQTLATSAGGTGGDVKIKREGAEKLATSATGIDVTGEVKGDTLNIDGAASIAGAVTDVTTLTASGEIEGGSLDINGEIDIDTGGSAFDVNTANGNFTVQTGTGDITFKSTDTSHSFVLLTQNSDNGNDTASPDFVLRKTEVQKDSGGSTVTAYDMGDIRFESRADNGDNIGYARIKGSVVEQAATSSASDGDSKLDFMVMTGATTNPVSRLLVDKDGIDVTGTVTADGLTLGNDEKIIIGSGNAFQIYHSSNDSIISEGGSGDLLLRGNNLKLQKADGGENYLVATSNGSVSIKHDNNTKLETASGGINVTGTVTADGLAVDGVATLTSGELTNNLIIESTNSGTSGAPDIILKRTKANNADNADDDVVGNFQYNGKTDNGTEVTWAATRGVIKDATNASYEGQFEIRVPKAGATAYKQVVVQPDLIKLQKPVDVTGKITATSSGIADNDVAVYGSGVADDDFLRINGTDVEGRSASEVLSDIGALSSSGNAASATLAKGSAEVVSSSATTGHATVAGYVGKTVIYTASSGDLTLGVPQCTEDLAVGEQIHFVNAATNSSSKIILDINEGHSDTQTISICTGATVTAESSADPHIVQGGVATLIAVSANNYVLFGSGVVDN